MGTTMEAKPATQHALTGMGSFSRDIDLLQWLHRMLNAVPLRKYIEHLLKDICL